MRFCLWVRLFYSDSYFIASVLFNSLSTLRSSEAVVSALHHLAPRRIADLQVQFRQLRSTWQFGKSGTRKTGQVDLPNKAALFHAGHDDKSKDGVGFYVSYATKDNVIGFWSSSARVVELQIWIVDKGKPRVVKFIQVYALRSGHNDDEYDAFLDEMAALLIDQRALIMMVMGDFNAKIGKRQNKDEIVNIAYFIEQQYICSLSGT